LTCHGEVTSVIGNDLIGSGLIPIGQVIRQERANSIQNLPAEKETAQDAQRYVFEVGQQHQWLIGIGSQ
jgi:hypothetical protein